VQAAAALPDRKPPSVGTLARGQHSSGGACRRLKQTHVEGDPEQVCDRLERRTCAEACPPRAAPGARLRQVPVVERDDWLDAGRQQVVHQAAVERQPGGVHGAGAARDHARPGDREAEVAQAKALR